MPTPFRYLAPVAALGLVALGACGDAPSSTEQTAPEPPASAEPPARRPAPPAAGDTLADAVVGTFDQTAAACTETVTMTRLTVSQDTLSFYYGYATVDAVMLGDGAYTVDATLYQQEGAVEVVPEPMTYRIEPQGDEILFGAVREGWEPSPLVRCDRR